MVESYFPTWTANGIFTDLLPTPDDGELPSSFTAAWEGFNASLYQSMNAVPALNTRCLSSRSIKNLAGIYDFIMTEA